MLSYLRVRGLALLDDVSLELAPGMNVLTGETGAGKSIIVDALTLLRGARAKSAAIRDGTDALCVDAQFDLSGGIAERIAPILAAHGLPTSDVANLVVQRTVPRAGRGRSFVQAGLTTQAVLAEIGEVLIDICSQHEHHSLTRVHRHLELLDGYANLEEQLCAYSECFAGLRSIEAELNALQERSAAGPAQAGFLRYQLQELERTAPQPGEFDRLRGKLELLRNARRWHDFAREAHEVLYEAEASVVARLASLLERARHGAQQSERLAAVVEQLEAAKVASEEADHEALRFQRELELEPGELEQAEARMSELSALRRKYRCDLDQVSAHVTALRAEVDALDHAEQRLTELEARTESLRQRCLQRADTLRATRQRARRGLAEAIVAELAVLHIPGARFEAKLTPLPPEQLGPRGLDRIEFLFSANPGEPRAPLNQVASGGELSRVLLAIKGVLSSGDEVATYVFDEVDAGVGGAVAVAIGQRLRAASRQHQLLCITHLPQIAAHADAHFRVDKRTAQGRTAARVVRLSASDRVEELARMLGGAQVTETARQHARQLLAEAQKTRESAPRPTRRRRSGSRSSRGATRG